MKNDILIIGPDGNLRDLTIFVDRLRELKARGFNVKEQYKELKLDLEKLKYSMVELPPPEPKEKHELIMPKNRWKDVQKRIPNFAKTKRR